RPVGEESAVTAHPARDQRLGYGVALQQLVVGPVDLEAHLANATGLLIRRPAVNMAGDVRPPNPRSNHLAHAPTGQRRVRTRPPSREFFSFHRENTAKEQR